MGGVPTVISATWSCLRSLMAGEAVRDREIEPGLALIRRQGLAPMAFALGAKSCRQDYVANLFDAEARAKVVTEAAATLAAGGVESTLIKGMSYIGDLYSDPAVRPMGDVDLLVRPAQMRRAAELLEGIGYADGTPGGPSSVHHAWQLFHCDTRRSIDLHQNIVQPWRSRIDLGEVWGRTRAAEDVPGARRLDPVDQLLFHLAHIGRSELWVTAISYVDAVGLEQRLDPEQQAELLNTARRYGLQRSVRAALAMTHALRDGADRPELPLWGRVLPSCAEVLAGEMPRREIQLARKAVLNDGWSQVLGLGAVFAVRRAAGWLGKRREARGS